MNAAWKRLNRAIGEFYQAAYWHKDARPKLVAAMESELVELEVKAKTWWAKCDDEKAPALLALFARAHDQALLNAVALHELRWSEACIAAGAEWLLRQEGQRG